MEIYMLHFYKLLSVWTLQLVHCRLVCLLAGTVVEATKVHYSKHCTTTVTTTKASHPFYGQRIQTKSIYITCIHDIVCSTTYLILQR